MKHLLILFLLIPALTFGQMVKSGVVTAQVVAAPAGCTASMISNGCFDDGATDWTAGTGWTIANGEATCDTLNNGWLTLIQTSGDMATDIVAGATYTLEFDLTVLEGGSGFGARMDIKTAGPTYYPLSAPANYDEGHITITLTAAGYVDETGIAIRRYIELPTNQYIMHIDNIVLTAD